MPTVGTGKAAKKFPYTKSGEKAAEDYAKKTGKKITYSPPMKTAKKGKKS